MFGAMLLAGLASGTGCARFQALRAPPPPLTTAVLEAAGPCAPSFSLEPGDVLRAEIWREKDMSGEHIVDEVGRVTLPMVGTVNVKGLCWNRLRDSLLFLFEKELKN